MARKKGTWKKEEPLDKRIEVRFTGSDYELMKKAAKAEKLDLAKFIRKTVLRRLEDIKNFLDNID